jgi:hypothetical protein
MTWVELCRQATGSRRELEVMDAGLEALAASPNTWLHAAIASGVPTLETLCAALDSHEVPLSYDVEARLVMPYRFADWPDETGLQVAMGTRVAP